MNPVLHLLARLSRLLAGPRSSLNLTSESEVPKPDASKTMLQFDAKDLIGMWVEHDEETKHGVMDNGDSSQSSFTKYHADGTYLQVNFDNHPGFNFYFVIRGNWTLRDDRLTQAPTSVTTHGADGRKKEKQPEGPFSPLVEIVTSLTSSERHGRCEEFDDLMFTHVKTTLYPAPMSPIVWSEEPRS